MNAACCCVRRTHSGRLALGSKLPFLTQPLTTQLTCYQAWSKGVRTVQAMLKRRNDQLQKMLDAASHRPDPTLKSSTTPRLRIDLRESQILDNPTAYNQPEDANLVGIKEDAEGELKAQQSSIRLMDRPLGVSPSWCPLPGGLQPPQGISALI